MLLVHPTLLVPPSTNRALEFMMAIMRRLLQKPEMSMSEVVYEQYHATLAQWHGFWASSAFNVSSRQKGGLTLLRASRTSLLHLLCFAAQQEG